MTEYYIEIIANNREHSPNAFPQNTETNHTTYLPLIHGKLSACQESQKSIYPTGLGA